MSKQEIPEYAKQHIDRLQTEVTELKATVDAQKPVDPLLKRIAEAFLLADVASDPGVPSAALEDKVTTSGNRSTPGADTRPPREARRRLRRNIEDALNRFDLAAEHHWFPPRPPKDPMRRCKNRQCASKDKRIPKYVGRGDSRIELSRCPTCDNKLYEA